MADLLPLASRDALEVRLGLAVGTLTGLDRDRADAALSDVSDIVRAEAGRNWVDALGAPITPDAVVVVVLQAAMRAYNNPDNYASESVGDYSYQREQGATSLYLTDDELRTVKAAVKAEDTLPGGWRGVGTIKVNPTYVWPGHRGRWWE